MNNKFFFPLAALAGFSAVVMGALGGHFVETFASPRQTASFQTAARFHMYHALALFALAVLVACRKKSGTAESLCAGLWTAGILLFSGTIYLKTFVDWPFPGFLTPLGGFAFMLGWLSSCLLAFGKNRL